MIFTQRVLQLVILLISFAALGQGQTIVVPFRDCKPQDVRMRLDNFCPRLEGVYLPGCCPVVAKSAPIQCYYHVNSTIPHYYNSQQTNCVNGQNVTTNCCAEGIKACKDQVVQLDFRQRLIKRDQACCFEYCPPADYWRSQPRPDPRVKPQHVLTGTGAPSLDCNLPPENSCTPGLSACSASDHCPLPPSPPQQPPSQPPSQPPQQPPSQPPSLPPPSGDPQWLRPTEIDLTKPITKPIY